MPATRTTNRLDQKISENLITGSSSQLNDASASEQLRPRRRALQFAIKPSTLLKSPVVRKIRQFKSGHFQDRMSHLGADRYRSERLLQLSRSLHRRIIADVKYQLKCQQETDILMVATEKGEDWTHLEPSLAIALARAAHETLEAERESLKEKIDECKAQLDTLNDAFDDASGRAEEARSQMPCVMAIFWQQGLHVDLEAHPPKPTTVLLELSTTALSADNVSDMMSDSCSSSEGSDDDTSEGTTGKDD